MYGLQGPTMTIQLLIYRPILYVLHVCVCVCTLVCIMCMRTIKLEWCSLCALLTSPMSNIQSPSNAPFEPSYSTLLCVCLCVVLHVYICTMLWLWLMIASPSWVWSTDSIYQCNKTWRNSQPFIQRLSFLQYSWQKVLSYSLRLTGLWFFPKRQFIEVLNKGRTPC